MGRRVRRSLGWGMAVAVLGGHLFLSPRMYSKEAPAPDTGDPYEKIAIFTRAIEQIRQKYVDEETTGYRELIYGALRGLMDTLDTHSRFLDPEHFSNMREDSSGQFGGVGIVVEIRDGTLVIIRPIENTPGFRAGLQAGDRIREVDGEPTDGITMEEAVERLRGDPGTTVRLNIFRPETEETQTLDLVRAVVSTPGIRNARMLEDGIAYLRIVQFSEPTSEAFSEALRGLHREGMRALIIDVRNNPGGLLDSAVDISRQLLPRGNIIVYTQGRAEQDRRVFRSRGSGPYSDLPLVVLTNEKTASAAEILAGALQDNRRAVLVGDQTFGKGSVQTVTPLGDGSALRLTTARYFTPGDRMIDGKGIAPNIRISMDAEAWRAILRSWAETMSASENSEKKADPVDPQLERALDILRGVLLFRARNVALSPRKG